MSRPGVVGVTAAGGVLCWGILADVSVGCVASASRVSQGRYRGQVVAVSQRVLVR